jgi:hypothetical protein
MLIEFLVADAYNDAVPHNTTFVVVNATPPGIKAGEYLVNANTSTNPPTPAQLGVYQQLASRAGGEVISSDSY